jgi:hypothetical protein
MAAEEVQLQLKVITSTRRKQAYMEVLETVSKAKRVKDLPQALRSANYRSRCFGMPSMPCPLA